MGNDFKAILTMSSGAISKHLKLSQSFTALLICPLYAVRGNGTNACRGIKEICDKLQHWLWASVCVLPRGKGANSAQSWLLLFLVLIWKNARPLQKQ